MSYSALNAICNRARESTPRAPAGLSVRMVLAAGASQFLRSMLYGLNTGRYHLLRRRVPIVPCHRARCDLAAVPVTKAASYHLRHFPEHAQLAGPTNKPEGIAAFRNAVQELPRNSEIVIYWAAAAQ